MGYQVNKYRLYQYCRCCCYLSIQTLYVSASYRFPASTAIFVHIFCVLLPAEFLVSRDCRSVLSCHVCSSFFSNHVWSSRLGAVVRIWWVIMFLRVPSLVACAHQSVISVDAAADNFFSRGIRSRWEDHTRNNGIKARSNVVGFNRQKIAMQTLSSDENSVCLSVRLSIRPSVKRVDCNKTEERSVRFLYHTKEHLA